MSVKTSELKTGDIVHHAGQDKFIADAMERWPNPKEGGGLARKKMWDVVFRDAPHDAVAAAADADWDLVEPVGA